MYSMVENGMGAKLARDVLSMCHETCCNSRSLKATQIYLITMLLNVKLVYF